MSYSLFYDENSKLIVSDIVCGCPYEHRHPEVDIYVGDGILENLPAYIQKRGLGTHCVLVADNNTYEIAGRRAERLLREAGIEVLLCVMTREGELEPDERACGEVLLTIAPETEFLISVGSGSVTDSTRVNAMRTGLPFVSVGTAPSMDGYTSVVAPLLLRGNKIHRQAVCPEIILCDTEILRTAPDEMIQGGVGDVLGKYIARVDWQISHLVNDEPYCDVCGELVTDAIEKLLDNIDEIKAKTERGIRILIEALLLAGLTIMIIGNTRAVASVEHNIAHFWDIEALYRGRRMPSHGRAVGVATLLVWPMFLRFAKEDISALDREAIRNSRMSDERRREWMLYAYHEEAGHTIMRENPEDFLTWKEQERRIDRLVAHKEEINALIAALPDFERVCRAMKRLGAPTDIDGIGVDRAMLHVAMWCCKDYRTRYTLFKSLEECGLIAKYLEEYPLPFLG